MKKLLQLTLILLLSLTVYSQNREVISFTQEQIVSQHLQGQQQLITDNFFGINASPAETLQFISSSKDWLLKDRTYTYRWDTTESYWKNTSIYFYYYDANYNLDERIEKSPDGSVLIQKNRYYYDDNNYLLLEQRIFDHDASEWVLKKKILYSYDVTNDNLLEKLEKNWDGSEFENYSKRTYVYYDNNKLDYYIIQHWTSDGWFNTSKWFYYYDQSNRLYSMLSMAWDNDISDWVDFSRNFLTRDEETGNLILMVSEYWNDEDYIWEEKLRQMYYYDDNGYANSMVATRSGQNTFSQVYTHLPAGSEQIMVKNHDIDKSIDDFQTTEDDIVVNTSKQPGRDLSLIGVEIMIDSVMHTSDGDLEFSLSHNGISETIIYQAGGDGDNFINTTLSDRGIDSVANGVAPFLGIYKAEKTLLPFAGVDPEGTWTLSIYDGVAGNTGVLKSWGLNLIYAPNSSIDDEQNETLTFHLFPNPAVDEFRVRSSEFRVSRASLELFGADGKKLLEKPIPKGSEEITVDVRSLKSGIYFCRITVDNKSVTKKLIIK